MPVGLGPRSVRGGPLGGGEPLRPGVRRPARFAAPSGVHPYAPWIAACVPALATLLVLARLGG